MYGIFISSILTHTWEIECDHVNLDITSMCHNTKEIAYEYMFCVARNIFKSQLFTLLPRSPWRVMVLLIRAFP